MPAPALRTLIDFEELAEVCDFWLPRNDVRWQEYWFSNIHDSLIKSTYFDLVNRIKMYGSASDLYDLINAFTPERRTTAFLGIVICLDQFVRNIWRNVNRTVYKQTDDLCFGFVQMVLDKLLPLDTFDVRQTVFVLLPFRHQRTTPLLNYVLGHAIDLIERIEKSGCDKNKNNNKALIASDLNILNRFKLATIKDYSNVTDTIQFFPNDCSDATCLNQPSFFQTHRESIEAVVLDDVCLSYSTYVSDSTFDANETVSEVASSELYDSMKKFAEKHKIENMCISLSGGVDSMAISLAMWALKIKGIAKTICAVHVDYGNRDVSQKEANCVSLWCQYLQIPLIIRRIDHIKRNNQFDEDSKEFNVEVDRAVYEAETKKIRFKLYEEAVNRFNVTCVVLGHHRDDLTENVLMNLLRGGDILDLFTMKEHQMVDGIPLSRPLLNLRKNVIYEFAHRFEVPYMKDTTSEDCMRGRVRKIVLPALEEVDPSIRTKIESCGNSSDQWRDVVNSNIINPLLESVTIYKNGLALAYKDSYQTIKFTAWQKILSTMFHRIGVRMVSNKNLIYFLKWLSTPKIGFMKLSNDFIATMYTDSDTVQYLLFIRQGMVSRIQKPALHYEEQENGTKISREYTEIEWADQLVPLQTVFNGWSIQIELVESKIPSTEFARSVCLKEIMDGEFSYYYRSSTTCAYLLHGGFTDSAKVANITYSMGPKNSDAKRFFKGVNMNRYIPMIHLGIPCNDCRNQRVVADDGSSTGQHDKYIVYKISYKYL